MSKSTDHSPPGGGTEPGITAGAYFARFAGPYRLLAADEPLPAQHHSQTQEVTTRVSSACVFHALPVQYFT
jgi:hypothetical protein